MKTLSSIVTTTCTPQSHRPTIFDSSWHQVFTESQLTPHHPYGLNQFPHPHPTILQDKYEYMIIFQVIIELFVLYTYIPYHSVAH
jgi:hypothetical protein